MMVATAISPEVARAERARRELARRRLTAFGSYVFPWWQARPHHDLVAEMLEQVETYIRTGGKTGIGRLIIEMPPRHGKTVEVSQIFPAWLLGRQPDRRVIVTSYGAELASDNSRAIRQIVTSERFAAIFGQQSAVEQPVELSEDARAKSNWDLAEPHRGGVVAAGVGGGITGKGAHLLVIDDPYKNREDADSVAYRKKVMNWYTSSAYTRLEEGGAVVIIHTRWHREDLSGELLKAMATDPLADQWTVLCLPALAYDLGEMAASDEQQNQALMEGLWRDRSDPLMRKAGEALWPQKYDEDALARIRKNLELNGGMLDWHALYQQQPRPQEGGFFDAADFEIVDRAPEKLRWMRYFDPAMGEHRTADFNSCVGVAMDENGDVYLRDMIRVQEINEFMARVRVAMLSPEEAGTTWAVETVAFSALLWQELMRDPSLASVDIRRVTPQNDKVTRCRPLQGRAKAGKVKLVRGPWVQAFILEALDFPNGRHDDQIDTAAGGLYMVAGPMTLTGRLVF